ncbi:MAG: FAD/FMN-binding oxidoreductase [Proteobacteria bacterium]|nr:FAD/FMN-binding oxidoreductase [Pseudomonadota bacterium]
MSKKFREIPYNYTSAHDELIVKHLFGDSVWNDLEALRSRRITGRSAKLLMRLMGDMFILRRNPFLYQDLVDSLPRKRRFFTTATHDLAIIEKTGSGAEVARIIKLCRKYLKKLSDGITHHAQKRRRMKRVLGAVIGKENIFFDPFTLISHSTDATDWRLYLPLAVLRPTREDQIAPLLKGVEELNLHVIPRGAGTGLTGGCVPVSPNCVIINTEKLNTIRGIEPCEFDTQDNGTVTMSLLHLESGVITQNAMEYASRQGLVFATDPTSSWACTIGGNIAENAGGKKAVMWGTAIDNLVSYRIAMPGGRSLEVRRDDHPLRKILHSDTVSFSVFDETGKLDRTIVLSGSDIRKAGLGKDITNKALNGLPGIQKEGTDGIITSARFILYPEYECKKTFCLEFFGNDMEEASRVIVEISKEFVNEGKEALIALEHFDDEYMAAINYKVKAPRKESPKAALLIDMVGHTTDQIESGVNRLETLLEPYANTYIFVAKDEHEAERFWKDRKKLGAIAKRTNAFKLNEDIVLPLDALGEFTSFTDLYNIEEDRFNQESFIHEVLAYLDLAEPLEDREWLIARLPKAKELCLHAVTELKAAIPEVLKHEAFSKRLLSDLLEFFRGYERILAEIKRLYQANRERCIVIATHMHAGDGNIHVNIPVFSNDMEMMARAAQTADAVMDKAVSLNGVVSGEHGIGITKMKYLDPKHVKALSEYRKSVDPRGVMNPGQLRDPKIHEKVFTPSFNLLELEARILQHGSLEDLAARISTCVRCGKCKIDCCTFYPKTNMFYHPRNKNLAIASLIEAILYDVLRSHSTRFKHLKQLEDIADHCTVCHKCLAPCPVSIDTGSVSILERNILSAKKFKHTSMATRLSLRYLQSQSKIINATFRKVVLTWGGNAQRLGHKLTRPLEQYRQIKDLYVMQMLKSPLPKPSETTLRDLLPACQNNQALVINPPGNSDTSVFYFPGCGSERLFSDISKASIYILLKAGIQVVLPPPFLCCGFPLKVNAKVDQHDRITLKNTIIFSQIREMLNYINFSACIISCGTCREALMEVDAENIFKSPITDISAFVLENGLKVKGEGQFLYHAPCHDSLQGKAVDILKSRAGYSVTPTPHCCSESGTMPLSRPDISNAMLDRKRRTLQAAVGNSPKVILTNCPACIQGLGRNMDTGAIPRHMAVELALKTGGNNWILELERLLKNSQAITF